MDKTEAWRLLDGIIYKNDMHDKLREIFPVEIVMECLSKNINLAFLSMVLYMPPRDEKIAEIVKYFVECGIPINCEIIEYDSHKSTLISEAIVSGFIITLKTLLKMGATNIGTLEPSWFTKDEFENIVPNKIIRKSRICLSIIDIAGYLDNKTVKIFNSEIKKMLKDRKDRYNASISFLCIAKNTRNAIIDKNLFIGMAKLIWKERSEIII